MLPVFYTVGCASSTTVLPLPTLLLGQMLPVFLYGWLRDPLLCYPSPYTTVGADAARYLYGWRRDPHCATPYTTPRLNAACFGAMSVGVLGGPSLCYSPTLHLG